MPGTIDLSNFAKNDDGDSGGSGTVTSVSAADGTIVVAGTGSDPTLKVAAGTFDSSGAAAGVLASLGGLPTGPGQVLQSASAPAGFPTCSIVSSFPTVENPLSGSGSFETFPGFNSGALKVTSSGVAVAVAGGGGSALWIPVNSANVDMYTSVLALNSSITFYGRIQARGSAEGYRIKFQPGGWGVSVSPTGSAFTSLGSGSITISVGDLLGVRIYGPVITLWQKPSAGSWTLVGTVTDTTGVAGAAAVTGPGYTAVILGNGVDSIGEFATGAASATSYAPSWATDTAGSGDVEPLTRVAVNNAASPFTLLPGKEAALDLTGNVVLNLVLDVAATDQSQWAWSIDVVGAGSLTINYPSGTTRDTATGPTSSTPASVLHDAEVVQYDKASSIIWAPAGRQSRATNDARYQRVVIEGLAIGRGRFTKPVGIRAHAIGDNSILVPAGSAGAMMFRNFEPLSDPSVLDVLPMFNNPLAMVGYGFGDLADAANAITIAAAIEQADGTIVPFTFGGNHTVTIGANYGPMVVPDMPLNIGAQVSAPDKSSVTIVKTGFWMRIWVQTAASRTDTVTQTGSGVALVSDTSITAADQGRIVVGTGVPGAAGNSGQTYVGTVVVGTSFLLSSSPTSQVNVNSTSSITSVTITQIIPCNYGSLANLDALSANGSADLTLPAGGTISGGSGNYHYGPAIILGSSDLQVPIIGLISDSILDGYSEDFHSGFFGSVARACLNLGYPLVKLSKGGEAAATWSTQVGGAKYRRAYLKGCTHVLISLGTNDQALTTGAGAGGVTTMLTRLTQIGQLCQVLGAKPIICTVPPRTASTDGWSTVAGQTPNSGSQITYLASLNSQLRAGYTWAAFGNSPTVYPAGGFAGVYDLCGLLNSSADSGLFAVGANSRKVTDAASTISTAVFTSATANFTTADLNTGLYVAGAMTNTNAVISAINSTTSVNITNGIGGAALNASATVSGAIGGIGAYATTIEGVHPTSLISTTTLTAGIQALLAALTLS